MGFSSEAAMAVFGITGSEIILYVGEFIPRLGLVQYFDRND